MGQMSNDAAKTDAQTESLKVQCAALSTGRHGQRGDAAVTDAQVLLRREECVLSMGQRFNANDAAVMDAQIELRKGDCV